MKYDHGLLYLKMKRANMSQQKLASLIGISQTTLNLKLNNHKAFTQDEIYKISQVLKIKQKEIPEYFFCSISKHNEYTKK